MQVKREAKIYVRKLPSGNKSYRVDLGTIHGKRVTRDFNQEKEAQKFAGRIVNEITTRELDAFIHVTGRASSTVTNYIRSLNAFFNCLVKAGYCSLNPVKKIERPTVEEKATAFLSHDEAKGILQTAL